MATTTQTHQRVPLGGFVFVPILALVLGAVVAAGIVGNDAWERLTKSDSVVTRPAVDVDLSTGRLPLSDSEAYVAYGRGLGEEAQALPLSDREAFANYRPWKAAGGVVGTSVLSDQEAYTLFRPGSAAGQGVDGRLMSDQEAWVHFGPDSQ